MDWNAAADAIVKVVKEIGWIVVLVLSVPILAWRFLGALTERWKHPSPPEESD